MTTYHITPVANGFIVDSDGDVLKTTVFQRENSDEMIEFIARVLQIHDLIYPPTGEQTTQTPIPFSVADPDI